MIKVSTELLAGVTHNEALLTVSPLPEMGFTYITSYNPRNGLHRQLK